LCVRLKKRKKLKLKVRNDIGKAYTAEEREHVSSSCQRTFSSHLSGTHAGTQRGCQRSRTSGTNLSTDPVREGLSGGWAKQDGSRRRPYDSAELVVAPGVERVRSVVSREVWRTRAEWYVFPFGRPRPSDPTRPITTFKTAWKNVRKNAKVTGRWHDNRHTLITDLAESGAWRSDHHGHRGPRLEAHAPPLQSYSNGGQAYGSQIERHENSDQRGRPDGGFWIGQRSQECGYPHRAYGFTNGRAEKSERKKDCPESLTITQHFEGEYPKSPHSR